MAAYLDKILYDMVSERKERQIEPKSAFKLLKM
ncbi:hypothetical protein VIBRN418_05851 [Vibrio sp. N418]|nr:hypothetical protein VIBRN418_05851 [Vibrio sp. N418]